MADELDILTRAAEGLLYPSESDSPFVPFRFAGIGADSALQVIADRTAPGTRIREQALDEFFAELLNSEDGEGYRALRQTLESHLVDLKVFRVGTINVDIYLIGQTATGDWAGLRTTSVET